MYEMIQQLGSGQFDIYFDIACLAIFAWVVVSYIAVAPQLSAMRDLPPGSILHEELFASGRSRKSWFVRMFYATSCLKITVTFNHLLVRPFFPFVFVGGIGDLIHAIPISAIQRFDERRELFLKHFVIVYALPDGSRREVMIFSSQRVKFKAAMESALDAARMQSPAYA